MVGDVLFLDSGNTRLKYSLNGYVGVFSALSELTEFISNRHPKHIVYSCVSELDEGLSQALNQALVPYTKVRVANDFIGLQLAYTDITSLGVDRWLSMLAAISIYNHQSLTVINAGTALTIDCIDSSRVHHGGSISPGYSLSTQALYRETAQLPKVSHEPPKGLGTSTTSCINYGIVQSMISLIETTVLNFDPDSKVLIGGGDSEFLAAQMNIKPYVIPELVLNGLKIFYQQSVDHGVK